MGVASRIRDNFSAYGLILDVAKAGDDGSGRSRRHQRLHSNEDASGEHANARQVCDVACHGAFLLFLVMDRL